MKTKLFLILLLTSYLYSESFEELKARSKKDISKFFNPCKNLSVAKCLARGINPEFPIPIIGTIPRIFGAIFIEPSDASFPITINKLKWDVEKTIKEGIPKSKSSCIELDKGLTQLDTIINNNLLIVNILKSTDNQEYKNALKLALTSIIYESNYNRQRCNYPKEFR